jgi:hypothetical protein
MEPLPIIVVVCVIAVIVGVVLFAVFTGGNDAAAQSGRIVPVAGPSVPIAVPVPPAGADSNVTATGAVQGAAGLNPPPAKGKVEIFGPAPKGTVDARKAEIEAAQLIESKDRTKWGWKTFKNRQYLMPNNAIQDEIDWLINTESLLNQVAVWAKKNRPNDKWTPNVCALFADPVLSRITMSDSPPNATSWSVVYWSLQNNTQPVLTCGRYGPYWASYNQMKPNPVLLGHVWHEFAHVAAGPIGGEQTAQMGHGSHWVKAFYFVLDCAQKAGLFDAAAYKNTTPGSQYNNTSGHNTWMPATPGQVDAVMNWAKTNDAGPESYARRARKPSTRARSRKANRKKSRRPAAAAAPAQGAKWARAKKARRATPSWWRV